MTPEYIEALQRLVAALKTYTEDRETSVPDEPVIPERIDPGHPVHNAVVEVEKHYDGKLPIEGGVWEAWRRLLWYSRGKGKERPFKQANRAYHWADKLQKWAEAKLCEPAEVSSQPEGEYSEPDGPSQWARKFKISSRTFTRYVSAGKIRAKKLSAKSYRVLKSDLPK